MALAKHIDFDQFFLMKWRNLVLVVLLSTFAMAADEGKVKGWLDDLKENPENESALFNVGLTRYLEGDFQESAGYFERLKEVNPADWTARAKLIQAYAGAGMKAERDSEIARLRKEHASGDHADLTEQAFFIRDQFEVAGLRSFALEYYELKGDRPLVWKFILKKDNGDHDLTISFGSYDATTELMRETGAIGKDERAYHLDGYGTDGSHFTYGIFKKNPGYDEVRTIVEKVLKGEIKEVSSTVPAR